MTKLDELIQQLCPDGVKYYTLNTICNVYDGTHQTPQYTDSGIKFASVENIADPYATEKYISVSDYEKYKIKPQRNDLLMTRIGSIGVCTVIESDEPLAYYVSLALLRPDNSILNSRYLKYAIESLHCRKELRKRTLVNAVPIKINMGDIGKITLPVPPLPVQREIVRILDNFTEITAELTAELTARKQQYEFYRDQLLTFAAQGETILTDKPNALNRLCQYVSEFIFVKLSDISVNCDSLRKPVTSGNREAGNIPYYGASGIVDYVKDYIFDGDYLLISEDGANLLARNTPIAFSISGKNWVNNHAHILRFNNRITQRYVEIYLNSIDLSPYISGGAQPKLNQQNLYKIPIPLPSYQKQKEIVTILDRFDTLCTDLSSGLPAEIEARQKQYEYYRDKLLSFEEKI